MAICRLVDDAHIGNAYLTDIDRIYRSATFGIFLGSVTDRGRGYGRDATRLILRHAFEVEGLHRVELDALVTNERAIRLYRFCGFREEGIRREAAFKNGKWVNVLRMAVLAHEYRAHRQQ
jgi:RimJ/RimL family protein N-acetyltransferase